MQFWKDAIDKAYAGRPPAEPVAVLLDKVLREDAAPLSKGFFRKVISSRVCPSLLAGSSTFLFVFLDADGYRSNISVTSPSQPSTP